MGFRPNAQHCKNVGTLIQCGECDKWHVIYSKSKLSSHENDELTRFLDEIQYTCGDTFYDISSSKGINIQSLHSTDAELDLDNVQFLELDIWTISKWTYVQLSNWLIGHRWIKCVQLDIWTYVQIQLEIQLDISN
ncbi:unnamed protein product [Rhizophagus irregularis]|nr:unnamed protein product [Rhizophagus irregularis]CAB5374113.1 unnamed protein product [Rhizophagus irregularis]